MTRAADPPGVLETIRAELEAIGLEGAMGFEASSSWSELDVDSIEVVELVAALEEHYDIDMANDDFNDMKTPRMLARRVSELVAEMAAGRDAR